MRPFETPQQSLGELDVATTAALVAASSDLTMVVDADGVIRDLAFGSDDLSAGDCREWLGKPWVQTVTVESRPKVEAALRELQANRSASWRHVNHPTPQGEDLPLMVAAVPLHHADKARALGRAVVFGRDLRPSAALQQQLVSAQQAMERDYWRMRHMETRYRSLFQVAREAVLIVESGSLKLEEANPAAQRLLGEALRRGGWSPPDGFDERSRAEVLALLDKVRSTGRPSSLRATLADGGGEVEVAASLFRQEKSAHLLLRVSATGSAAPGAQGVAEGRFMQLIDAAPDAFVVTDLDGAILSANRAFLELAQLASPEQARGEPLERWLGRTGVDLRVLLTNLRQRSVVRLFATVVRGEFGSTSDVEVSAVAVAEGERPCLGFAIRDVGRRLGADQRGARELPRSVGQMTELVGRMPLKDIVRETTDLIEQLCIEAALQLTADNRASAAEMLGLSRQSLYVKLRRFNMGDLSVGADE